MRPGASQHEIDAVIDRLDGSEVDVGRLEGRSRATIAALGADGDRRGVVEAMKGVERVVPVSAPYQLASWEVGRFATSFEVSGRTVGGGETFCLIAGPCTVESFESTCAIARAVQRAGASMLRGGAFKPRTSPFAFRGLGVAGLEILSEIRAATGLPVVTELLDVRDAELFATHADVVQIGARNMQNYALLEVAGELGLPVLLKRGMSSTLDELLMAADYILKEGNERVMLCERGIRTFDTSMRFTLDLGAVPWLKAHTHLPVIVDPSHAAGDRRLVEPLSRAAAAVGADGLLIEVHEEPEAAVCDGAQMVRTTHFGALAEAVREHAALLGKRIA